ncbi:MAG: hypothetical protein ACI4QX_07780 [Lachnospiraceae bacterium]
MKKKSLMISCIIALAGILGACTGERTELLPTPTAVPVQAGKATAAPTSMATAAVTPELTVLPTVTTAPEEDLLPIDEKHFSGAVFRERIAENYDTNGDGYLSEEERNEVTYIEISYSEHEFEGEQLDGFEYFSNLEEVHVSQGEEVILRNLPSLRRVTGEEGYIGTLTVENCPKIEEFFFYNIALEKLIILGDTTAELEFAHNSGAGQMVLDGNISLNFEDSDYELENYIYTNADGDVMTECYNLEGYVFNDYTEWTNLGEKAATLNAEEVMEGLLNCRLDFFAFEVREMLDGNVDAKGNKGWNIAVDYKEAGYKSNTFLLYTEEEPIPDNFLVRPGEIQEVHVMAYSPKRGIYSKVKFNLKFVYRTEQEEIVLGEREKSYYVIMKPDGASKVYRPLYDEEARRADW